MLISPSESTDLQCEGQHHVRLGQRILVLLAHVHDGGVVTSLQLLQLELSSLGHRHALQVGHQQVHRGPQLLDEHGLHLSGGEPRKPSTVLIQSGTADGKE